MHESQPGPLGVLRAFVISGGAVESGPDDALVAAAQADPEAFAAVYERYLPRVYRYLAAKASSPEEAADITQAVFLKAFDSLGRFRPGKAPFASWLFRIARNAAIDASRRSRPGVSLDADPGFGFPGELLLEEETLRRERLRELRAAVAKLKPEQRDLIALRYAGGLTIKEIALLIGKRPEAAKKQLQRTLRELKEHYRDDE